MRLNLVICITISGGKRKPPPPPNAGILDSKTVILKHEFMKQIFKEKERINLLASIAGL